MPATVPRQKNNRMPIESGETEFVRSPAERALDPPPSDVRQAVDPVKPAAADNADDAVGHGSKPREVGAAATGVDNASVSGAEVRPECVTRSCASRRRRLRSSPEG